MSNRNKRFFIVWGMWCAALVLGGLIGSNSMPIWGTALCALGCSIIYVKIDKKVFGD